MLRFPETVSSSRHRCVAKTLFRRRCLRLAKVVWLVVLWGHGWLSPECLAAPLDSVPPANSNLSGVPAESVTLAWDANLEPDIAGYRLHYGTSSGTYTDTIDVGISTFTTVANLTAGITYFAVVTAYNTTAVESKPSNEVSFTTVPKQPAQPPAAISAMQRRPDGSIQFTLTNATATTGVPLLNPVPVMDIEVSDDLTTWVLLIHLESPPASSVINDPDAALVDRRFYRISTR